MITDRPTAHDVATAWRPERPGALRAHDVPDPIVEPEWGGVRVAVALTADRAAAFREGAPQPVPDELAVALVEGFTALEAVVEGRLTRSALQTDQGATPPAPAMERPALLVPRFLRRGRAEPDADEHEARAADRETATLDELERGVPHAFVATDLLHLDGQALHDIPLLERKRLLASVLVESDLVRLSPHVRPSAAGVLASWAALGFTELSYRDSNHRFLAGCENPAWAIVRAPAVPMDHAVARRA